MVNPDKNKNIMGAVLSRPSKNMGVSLVSQDIRSEIKFVSIEMIVPFKRQPRTIFEERSLHDLADSIKSQGVIQPLQVIPSQEEVGKYEVVSGERRLKASKIAGLEKVPCIVLDSKKDSNLVSLIENIQREDLNPIDLANAIGDLVKTSKHGDKSTIALKLGMNPSLFSQYLTIFNLPIKIKTELLKKNSLPFYKILSLSKLGTEEKMFKAINSNMKNNRTISFVKVKFDGENLLIEQMNQNRLTKQRQSALKKLLASYAESL